MNPLSKHLLLKQLWATASNNYLRYLLIILPFQVKQMACSSNTTDHTLCHLWPANPHRCQVILNVQRSSSSLSLFGCVVVVLLISILDKFKSITQRLIFWLSVSGLLISAALLLKNVHETHTAYCRFKRFFHNYFSWAVLL